MEMSHVVLVFTNEKDSRIILPMANNVNRNRKDTFTCHFFIIDHLTNNLIKV